MKMGVEGAIDCLMDKTLCKFCKYQSENCRQEAINISVQSMKAWDDVMKDVQDWQDDFNGHIECIRLTDAEKEATMSYGEDVVNIIGNHLIELKEVEE